MSLPLQSLEWTSSSKASCDREDAKMSERYARIETKILNRALQRRIFMKLLKNSVEGGEAKLLREPSPLKHPSGKYRGVAAIPKGIAQCPLQKQHFRNDATKGALRQCASILRQYIWRQCWRALQAASALQQYCCNTSIETDIAAMHWSIATIRAFWQCAEALQQYPIVAMRCHIVVALWQSNFCGGVASCFPWRFVVAVRLLIFVVSGARWSPELSLSFVGAPGDPLNVGFCSQGHYVVPWA